MRQLRLGFLALVTLSAIICIIAGCLASRPRQLNTPTAVIPGPTPAGQTWPIQIPTPGRMESVAVKSVGVDALVAPRPSQPTPSVRLSWDVPPGPTVSGYRVKLGWVADVWVNTIYCVTNLITITNLKTHPYAFQVTAIGTDGLEGPPSDPGWFNVASNGSIYVSNGIASVYVPALSNHTYAFEYRTNLTAGNYWATAGAFSNRVGVQSVPLGTNAIGYSRITVH